MIIELLILIIVELYNVEVVVLVILVVKNILLNDLVSMKIPKTLDVLD